jgi:hypothetical protein
MIRMSLRELGLSAHLAWRGELEYNRRGTREVYNMGLLRKLRVLAGALVHKPLMPKSERVDLDDGGKMATEERPPGDHLDLGAQEPGVTDSGRVADLIASQQERAD